jgi:tetratricopeptide (TPR) repeat protein
MKRSALWLTLLASGCASAAKDPAPPAVVRIPSQKTDLRWDEMPGSLEARRKLAESEAKEGARLLAAKEELRAVAHLRRAVDLHPGSAALRLQLAQGFERIGDPDAALRVLREARRIAPRDAEVLSSLGRLLFLKIRTREAAELREAREAWRAYLGVSPSARDAGEARRHLSEIEKALAEAKVRPDGGTAPAMPEDPRAVPRPPGGAPAPMGPPTAGSPGDALLAGNELMERGRYRDAARAYAKAAGADAEARRLWGQALYLAGDAAGAVRAWEPLSRSGKLDRETKALYEQAKKKAR